MIRTQVFYTECPKEREYTIVDNHVNVRVRTNIQRLPDDEYGNEVWVANEYDAVVSVHGFAMTDELVNSVVAHAVSEAAASVRKLRNELLDASDREVLPDRTNAAAWTEYRQALRDIPEQEGFPFAVTWPHRPE